jgi:DNA-binding transcriptional MerR regulator
VWVVCGKEVAMQADVWNRKEVTELTGITTPQLIQLEKAAFIVPVRDDSRPYGYRIGYSWKDLIELRAYRRLREHCSFQSLRQAIKALDELQLTTDFSDKRLVAYGNRIFWIEDTPESLTTKIIQLTGKNPGQILLTFTYSDLVEEIWDRALFVTDFESRAKERPNKHFAVA